MLAHELSHVKNRDVLIATIAAAVAGLIATLGHVLQWGLMWIGPRSDEDRGGGLAALAWIIVAPIVALLIQLAISRSRESRPTPREPRFAAIRRCSPARWQARTSRGRSTPTSSPAPRPPTCSS